MAVFHVNSYKMLTKLEDVCDIQYNNVNSTEYHQK